MGRFRYPKPILDEREEKLLNELTSQYKKFIEPGKISKLTSATKKQIEKIIPPKIKDFATESSNIISEAEFIKTALKHTGKGLSEFHKQTSKLTFSKTGIVATYKNNGLNLSKYEQISALRSYDLTEIVNNKKYFDLLYAFINGGATGFFGFAGVPFNIPISFFLFFRVVQSIALYYGYDIKKDSAELDIAANVMIMALAPNKEEGVETIKGMLGKMMIAANASALRKALSKSYSEIAKRGGLELFYVQLRALGNKSAQKALEKSGEKNIEFGVFKKIMEQISLRLSKETTKKFIPVISAFIGAGSDTYYMHKVIKGAILIYHKRFLIEKEKRVLLLRSSKSNTSKKKRKK